MVKVTDTAERTDSLPQTAEACPRCGAEPGPRREVFLVCDACGHEFEEFQSMTADVLTKCPKCKKKKLRRKFGIGGAIVFKGSGFYTTDYRSDAYKKQAAADAKPPSDEGGSSSKTESKSESKPAKSEGGGDSGKK